MQVSGSGEFFVVKAPEEVAKPLKDPATAARLILGLSSVRETGGGEYVGEAAVRLGHLSGKMLVKFRYAEVREDGVRVVGSATGLQTTADFSIAVEPRGGGTLVKRRFQGTARGLAASLAPGIVRSASKKMAEDAAKNFAQHLQSK